MIKLFDEILRLQDERIVLSRFENADTDDPCIGAGSGEERLYPDVPGCPEGLRLSRTDPGGQVVPLFPLRRLREGRII